MVQNPKLTLSTKDMIKKKVKKTSIVQMKHTKQKDLFFFQCFIANKTFNISYDMTTKTHQQRVYSLASCH